MIWWYYQHIPAQKFVINPSNDHFGWNRWIGVDVKKNQTQNFERYLKKTLHTSILHLNALGSMFLFFFKKLFLAEFDLFLHASPIFSGFGYFFPSSITKSFIQSLKPPFWFFWTQNLTGNRFMSFSKYSVHDLIAKTGSEVGEIGKIQFSK